MTKKKDVALKITVAVVIDGKIVRPGETINVDDRLARNLLQRGRAVLSTDDKPKAEPKPEPKADEPKAKAADKPKAEAKPAEA